MAGSLRGLTRREAWLWSVFVIVTPMDGVTVAVMHIVDVVSMWHCWVATLSPVVVPVFLGYDGMRQ